MQQIEGLPAGAVVKPLQGAQQNIQGLPEGAVLKPVSGGPEADPASVGQSLDTTQPAIGQKPQEDDPGFWHGVWENSLGPLFQQAEAEHQEVEDAPDFSSKAQIAIGNALKHTTGVGVPKMLWGMVKQAYDQGKQAVNQGGEAARGYVAAGKSALAGDGTTAMKQARDAGQNLVQAEGHGLAAAVPGFGPMAAKAGEDIGKGKTGEGLGEGASAELQVLLGGMTGRKATTAPAEFSEVEAAKNITDAVNPSAQEMPKFSAAVTKHVHPIMEYAERNDLPIATREDFGNAAQALGKERSSIYYEKMVQPIKDDYVGLGDVPNYSGDTVGEMNNIATISQLDSRLTQINAELNPSFNKASGQQAQAALSNESHAALTAEAQGIRKTLFRAMSKKLGVGQDIIAQTRASIGELKHVAEQTEFNVNQERHATNAEARQPLTINPLHKSNAKFVADEAVNAAANRVRTSPDDAIRNTFKHLQPKERSGVASIREIMDAKNKPARDINIKNTNIKTGKRNAIADQRSVARSGKHGGNGAESQPIGQPETDTERATRTNANAERMSQNQKAREANRQASEAERVKDEEVRMQRRQGHGKMWKQAGEGLGE